MSDVADNPNPDAAVSSGVTLTPADIAALLDKLGVDPATADVAAILAKIDALNGAATEAQTAVGSAQSTLAELQAKYDSTYADLNSKQEELSQIYQAKAQAEADGILEQYTALFPPGEAGDKAKATMRSLLLADRGSAVTILDGMKRDATEAKAEGAKGTPPAAVHDPANAANAGMTAEQKATAVETLIKTVQKEGKFKDYTSAREEARRRQPELFS
ncbi:MAG TPA: hypothetical protein VK961_26905 [Chthoniobacter sp.]|nr:hypothetical protein [Chthoniobacter sp.]